MEQSVTYLNPATNLSAEVEPFVPRSDINNLMAEQMIPQSSQGPLPHYLTSCYPFVQDPNGNNLQTDQFDYHNYYKDTRGYPSAQVGPNPHFQHLAGQHGRYPDVGTQSAAASNMPQHSTPIYAYHPDSTQLQYANFAQVQYQAQYAASLSQNQYRKSHARRDHYNRHSNDRRQHMNKKNQRSVGIQMEIRSSENKSADRSSENMIDCALQTDFPSDIACKTLVEKPSPLKKMTRAARRRKANVTDRNASCESSDNNGEEADVDSDSGYYSPKHQLSKRKMASGGHGTHEPGYLQPDVAHQRLMYHIPGTPSGHPSALYHIHPNSFLGGSHPPGSVIRLPSPATPPMIMTPPPSVMSISPNAMGHQVALTNFKSRSPWEQEVLKAHNVGPVCPPNFIARNRAPFPQSGSRGNTYQQKNWTYPRFQGPKQSVRQQNSFTNNRQSGTSPAHQGHGLLRVNPNTAPRTLVHQNPPQLTDEDFPDLQPSSDIPGQGVSNQSSISYSAALQRKPKLPTQDHDVSDDSPIKCVIEADDSNRGSRRRKKKTERAAKAAAEEYAEITEEQENLKKKLNNNKATAKQRSSQLDLGEMLSKLEKSQNKSEDEESTQKRKPQSSNKSAQPIQRPQEYSTPLNPLDATAPVKKRGKERETPKVKKPSALKKVILKEREEKKTARITTLTTEDAPEYDIPPVATEFFKREYMQMDDPDEKSASDGVSGPETNNSGTASPVLPTGISPSQIASGEMPKIHSRRYREYCSGQVLDKEIDEECIAMLQKLVQFQERTYQKDPMNAKNKRRFVLGIREVTKHLKLRKLCCVLISPNLEKIQAKGGLDDALQQIIQLCKSQTIPYVFALGRRAMGRAVSKLVPVSIIGIFNYNGAEESYKKMLSLVNDAQKKYDEMMVLYKQEITEAIATPPTAPPAPKRFPHMGHSRNPSAASGISFCSMISEPISEMPPDGTSWRNMMDVTDEQNPTPTLSPPAETAQEEELQVDSETQDEKAHIDPTVDPVVKDMLDNSFDSTGSEEKPDQELKLESSFSTVSTVVPQNGKSCDDAIDTKSIDIVVERSLPVTDTEARIESWLASSVQSLEINDSRSDDKLDKKCTDEPFVPIEEEDDDFLSTHEDDVNVDG